MEQEAVFASNVQKMEICLAIDTNLLYTVSRMTEPFQDQDSVYRKYS